MRILIAPDKFKGSLTAKQVCDALAAGIGRKIPGAECISFPLADGGDGTAEILTYHSGGRMVKATARDPLLRPIEAGYGLSPDSATAFIEMADASGLRLLKPSERDVMKATTAGTGDLIRDAIGNGARTIILGIGGSATNDGATGAAHALGFSFFDRDGRSFLPAGESLSGIFRIDKSGVLRELNEVNFIAVCDVDNPLTGEQGAAAVYAPQKGATREQVGELEAGLRHLAHLFKTTLGKDVNDLPGAGGGGGFGGGAVAFFDASLRRGTEVVFEYTGFEEQVRNADVVITGEGKMDDQTLRGKVVAGVAALAEKYRKPLFAMTGINMLPTALADKLNFTKILSIKDHAGNDDPMAKASQILEEIGSRDLASEILRLRG